MGPILDVEKPLWPLFAIPLALLGIAWAVEVVEGLI